MSSGTCGCLDYDLKEGDDYLRIVHALAGVPELLDEFDSNIQRKVAAVICNGVSNFGDHLQVYKCRANYNS